MVLKKKKSKSKRTKKRRIVRKRRFGTTSGLSNEELEEKIKKLKSKS